MSLKIDASHTAVFLTALALALGAQFLPAGSLAAWGAKLGPWLSLGLTILGLFTKSLIAAKNTTPQDAPTVPDASAIAAIAAAAGAKKDGQAGYVRDPALIFASCAGLLCMGLCVLFFACGNPAKDATIAVGGIDLGVCILEQPPGTTITQYIAACKGATETLITQTLAAADKHAARRFACVAASADAGKD